MTTSIEKRIIKQVEYYFGDTNFPRDRFLQEQIKLDDGWVALDTMIKFNRLKEISEDKTAISEALKKATSGLVEVHSDNLKIRRSPDKPVPDNTDERRVEMSAKTIYAKEFPANTTLDALQEFFEVYGEVENIFMRKNEKREFKGSVFVTFSEEEAVKKFLDAESVKFADKELEIRKTKTQYYREKGEEKKRKQQEEADKKLTASHRHARDEVQKYKNDLTHGTILHMKNFADGTSREDIRNMLQDHAPIHWIDFNKGDEEAYIRYDKENQAQEALDKANAAMNNEIILNGNKLECRVLEGDEEEDRWKQMYQQAKDRLEKKRSTKNFQKGRWGKRPSKSTREALKKQKQDEEDAAKKEREGPKEENGKSSEGPPEKKIKLDGQGDVSQATTV